MARERKVPDFSPDQLDQIESIKKQVLDSPGGNPPPQSPAEPAPRPMLPNFYEAGGSVTKFGSSTSVSCKHK